MCPRCEPSGGEGAVRRGEVGCVAGVAAELCKRMVLRASGGRQSAAAGACVGQSDGTLRLRPFRVRISNRLRRTNWSLQCAPMTLSAQLARLLAHIRPAFCS